MGIPARPPTLLLVEDDPRTREALELALEASGHDVVAAATGGEALQRLRVDRPDVVLLDLALPDMNGIDLCREIRVAGDVPVIMLTARAETEDVVIGLEAGADAYVTKPARTDELAARVAAVLRRSDGGARPKRWGRLEIALGEGRALLDGRQLSLTKTELLLLCVLAAHPGRVVTREHLLERVWGHEYVGDTRLLDVHLHRLRTKVEVNPHEPELVVTVRRVGYKLSA